MRDASVAYIQEEKRHRGARPRLKAALSPFELDYGLTPDVGKFWQTEYGAPGALRMQAGYLTQGSWTSPVMQSHLGRLSGTAGAETAATATLSWVDEAGYVETSITLRTAETLEAVLNSDYRPVATGHEFAVQAYFQLQVNFQEKVRVWALEAAGEVDEWAAYATEIFPDAGFESYGSAGDFPGGLTGITLSGEIVLPESEIIDPGDISVSMAQDFADLTVGDNVLVVDNRNSQWIPGGGNFYLQAVPWFKKYLKLYHGFELPGGEVEWQLIYLGQIEKISGMSHGWGQAHTARLETVDLVVKLLEHSVGAPAADGRRQPFLRGYWYTRAELTEITEPFCQTVKQGSGSATLAVDRVETYSSDSDATYLVEIETTGEVGTATFRWSKDQGHTWQGSGLLTAGMAAPVELEENLLIYWIPGLGVDLIAGDFWTLAVMAKVCHYTIPGAPFEAITEVAVNGEKKRPGISVEAELGAIAVTGGGGEVTARLVKDSQTHPVDIIGDILTEAGLGPHIDPESFAQARSDTLGYAIGVGFENVSAGQAIRQIVERCLYDFWVECGVIKIRAYLGEE